EFEAILRFWLDRGIDGFRIDVAHGLVKDMTFPDLGANSSQILSSSKMANHPFWDRDAIHEIVRQWRAVVDEYDGDRMMVAEAWVDPKRLPLYLRPDEYHQSFNFDILEAEWEAEAFEEVIASATKAASEVGSTPTWVLSNHDVMRETTRYGLPNGTDWRAWPTTGPADQLDVAKGRRRARAAALLLLGLPGSAYIYQGEELGLPEVWDLPEDVLDDPVWERSGHTRKGRDGCRVPLPWLAAGPSLGFGDGEPWLPQPDDWSTLSAEAQAAEPGSSLQLYTTALALRRRWGVGDEQVALIDIGPDVVGYRRGSGLMCIVNFGAAAVDLPAHEELLLHSDDPAATDLAPDCAVWLR
ncbi:MAG: alpha-amylase family glycosyl hydrolase, partial [Acidimicrobiales bacterium]